jgi:hypothetical protein
VFFGEGKLESSVTHQLTQRIVLCIRDDLEDPAAAKKLLSQSRRSKEKQP